MTNTATLDALWISTRRHLLSLANGATANYDPKTMGGEDEGYGPPFRHDELAEFEHRWAGADGIKAKRAILIDTLEILFYLSPPARKKAALPFMPVERRDQLRKLTIGQMPGTREWREAVATDQRPAGEVALAYGIRKGKVLACREEFKVMRRAGAPNGNQNAAKSKVPTS